MREEKNFFKRKLDSLFLSYPVQKKIIQKEGYYYMIGEAYSTPPRITSTYTRTMFSELCEISNHIDFNQPQFERRFKRNRSLGSVQAFIVELAFTDDEFREKLKKYMLYRGSHWTPTISHMDRY